MKDLIIQAMNNYGYIAILFFVVLENILPFIPSEVILTFAGFMTTKTNMTVLNIVILATVFSILGSLVLYALGRVLSEERLIKLIDTRIGRMMGFKKEDICKSREWFNKKGKYTVFFCRCVPVLRCLISLPAGMSEMNIAQFCLFTGLGSLVWNIFLVNLGAWAGSSWEIIVAKVGRVTSVVGAVILIALAVAFLMFLKKRVREAKLDDNQDNQSTEA